MNRCTTLDEEIKLFIIDALALEDITPSEIASDAPLFGGGLGLDSVDALELGVALQKRYGIRLDPKDESTKQHFSSVSTLVELVATTRSSQQVRS
jgi:acyl carrier protein